MIPTYNCAKFLEKTLLSILEQAPYTEYMQIEVIDDCSQLDNPEEVVRRLGKGRVAFYKQPKNVGVTQNFNTCIERAKGKWIHILHGDDFVLRNFYEAVDLVIKVNPYIGAFSCRSIIADEDGVWQGLSPLLTTKSGVLENFSEILAVENLIRTPSIIVRRDVYEEVGGFNLELSHTADWEMWQRIGMNYPVWYDPQPLAVYREHSKSDTSRLMRTGQNVKEMLKCTQLVYSQLPQQSRDYLVTAARQRISSYGVETAYRFCQKQDWIAALSQIYAALQAAPSLDMIAPNLISLLQQRESQPITSLFIQTVQSTSLDKLQELLCDHLNISKNLEFNEINVIGFPSWNTSIEIIYEDLVENLSELFQYSQAHKISLFLYLDKNLDLEDEYSSFLSEVILSLSLEQEIELPSGLKINLLNMNTLRYLLVESQGKCFNYRFELSCEDIEAVKEFQLTHLSALNYTT